MRDVHAKLLRSKGQFSTQAPTRSCPMLLQEQRWDNVKNLSQVKTTSRDAAASADFFRQTICKCPGQRSFRRLCNMTYVTNCSSSTLVGSTANQRALSLPSCSSLLTFLICMYDSEHTVALKQHQIWLKRNKSVAYHTRINVGGIWKQVGTLDNIRLDLYVG